MICRNWAVDCRDQTVRSVLPVLSRQRVMFESMLRLCVILLESELRFGLRLRRCAVSRLTSWLQRSFLRFVAVLSYCRGSTRLRQSCCRECDTMVQSAPHQSTTTDRLWQLCVRR